MKKSKDKSIPIPSVKRLSRYLRLFIEKKKQGIEYMSSSDIAGMLQIDSGIVRKDFQYAGINGRPRMGYCIEGLIIQIDEILKWSTTKKAVVIGAGSIGSALLKYDNFVIYGIKFVLAYDNSLDLIGTKINNIYIHDINKLTEELPSLGIEIAVITTPSNMAQSVADKLVEAGIKGIWNFAPYPIKIPENIVLVNSNFSDRIAVLTQRIG